MDKNINEFQRYVNSDFLCVSLSGDEFSIEEAIKILKENFKGWEFEAFFTGEEERIISSIISTGIFDNKKIILIYYPENINPNNRKEIINCIKKFKGQNKKIVIITGKENIISTGNCKSFRFYPLYDYEIENWIRNYIEKTGGKITDDAIAMLKLLFGNDRKEIVEFLKPLINQEKKIEPKDLFRFNVIRENAVFESIENFFKKNIKTTLESFIISESENKYYALLLKETIDLLDLKLKKNVDKFQNSFIMKKKLKSLENWEIEELFVIFKNFIELESKIKIGYNSFDMTIINIFKLLKGGKDGYG